MPDLDLTHGRPQPSGPPKGPAASARPSGQSEPARQKAEKDLKDQLEGLFVRISDALERRNDGELSTALAEDKKIMSGSLVSLTGSLKFLRRPLVLGLSFIEPIMAFGRVGGILMGRIQQWRQESWEANQAEQQAQQRQAGGGI